MDSIENVHVDSLCITSFRGEVHATALARYYFQGPDAPRFGNSRRPLTDHRSFENFHAMMRLCEGLEPARSALREAGKKFFLLHKTATTEWDGVYLLVHPQQYDDAVDALNERKPSHDDGKVIVVVAASLEDALLRARQREEVEHGGCCEPVPLQPVLVRSVWTSSAMLRYRACRACVCLSA